MFQSLGTNLARKGYGGSIIDSRNNAVAANYSQTLIEDIPYECQLEWLEWGANQQWGAIYIAPYKSDGTLSTQIYLVDSGGIVVQDPDFNHLNSDFSAVFSVDVFNTTSNLYKAHLKSPLYFPSGCKIAVYSTSGTSGVTMTVEGFIAQYQG